MEFSVGGEEALEEGSKDGMLVELRCFPISLF